MKTPISPSKREEKIPNDYSQDSPQEDKLYHFSETAALPLPMINDDLTIGGKDLNILNLDLASWQIP